MEPRAPFNAVDPFDALANITKSEVADAALRVFELPAYKSATAADVDTATAMMAGALTGICGILMSHFNGDEDQVHAVIRASMVAYLPQAVDNARSILGLPPLPEARN